MSSWYGSDNAVYVPLEEVKARVSTSGELIRATWPEELAATITRPTAILARHIASPNYEMLWFVRLARRHGFQTLVLEHVSDQFTAKNPAKRALAKMPIVAGRTRTGQPIIRSQKILDLSEAEGIPLQDVITFGGENLVAYHHRRLKEVMGADAPGLIDIRQLLPGAASRASDYYPKLFKMLYGYLVLFEDFVADINSATFFQEIVLPAWHRTLLDTGRQPQVVRLVQGRRASSTIWSAYPTSLRGGQN